MSETLCSNLRRQQGMAYPRTCAICRLGPCINPDFLGKEKPKLEKVAPAPAVHVERIRNASELPAAIELWFFRDLGETARRQLFGWCGIPGFEVNGEEVQRALLHAILAALRAPGGEG